MNEMIEKVAEAIWLTGQSLLQPTGNDWQQWLGDKRPYRKAARAAIEALREPTEAMLNGARDWSGEKYGKPIGNDAADGCFRAMIDAALAEEKAAG